MARQQIVPEAQRIEEPNFYEPLAFLPQWVRRFFVGNEVLRTLSRFYALGPHGWQQIAVDEDGYLQVTSGA